MTTTLTNVTDTQINKKTDMWVNYIGSLYPKDTAESYLLQACQQRNKQNQSLDLRILTWKSGSFPSGLAGAHLDVG